MRLAIIEDTPEDQKRLIEMIQRYMEDNLPDTDSVVDCFVSADEFICGNHGNYDILFLDIEMPGTNGMDAAAEIRKRDAHVPILFVTQMAQYAVRGYDVGAVGFVLKPIRQTDFDLSMRRAVSAANVCSGKAITINSREEGIHRLMPGEIRYVEVQRHKLIYYTTEGILSGTGSLNELMEQNPGMFLMCSRSYLVNPHYIRKIRGLDIQMSDGSLIPIGRTRKKEFMEQFSRWLGEGNEI